MKKALKVPREHETNELIYISDSEFKFQKEKKMHSHFKRTIWQPRNHNSPVKGMSQRLFRKWIVSGSRGPFWKQVWSRAQPHFLGLQQKMCSRSLHITPIHPHIPSAPLQTGSAPALVLQEKTEFSSWGDWSYIHRSTARLEKSAVIHGFSSNGFRKSARRPDFQEWIKWRNMEPVPTVSNLKDS